MPSAESSWGLVGFIERFDAWIDQEAPQQDLRLIVAEWIMSRMTDPYKGAEREPDYPNLWFARVPGSHDGNGGMVVCAYMIEAMNRTVRCGGITTMNPPFL